MNKRNSSKYIILLTFFLIIYLPINAQKIKKNSFNKTSVNEFFINTQPQFEKLFNTVYSDIKSHLNKLYWDNFYPTNIPPVEVILIKDKNRWRKLFLKYPFSEWGAGLAIPAKNKIYILIENFSISKIQETLIHEWLHQAIHHKFINMKIPTWYEEGIVQKLSGKRLSVNDLRFLANKILSDNLLTFKQIDSLIYYSGSKVQIGYIQSLIAVQSMEELTGIKNIDKQLLSSRAYLSENFYTYFIRNAKISPDAFESRYLKHIKNKYKWFFIFNLENILFILGIIVLLGAYYHIKYRNKKIMESWEEQEIEETE
ncbi:MAG: hypothetical protein KAR38_04265 [Calditrichia bacterium]|nr:hypothetical protein [Calditrichia bacterium]